MTVIDILHWRAPERLWFWGCAIRCAVGGRIAYWMKDGSAAKTKLIVLDVGTTGTRTLFTGAGDTDVETHWVTG